MYSQRRQETRVILKKELPKLRKLKKEQNQAAFNELLLQVVPEIKYYIKRRINTAIAKGHFSKNKYATNDFIDQLFVETYDHIEEFNDEDEFSIWLYKMTNQLLEDAFTEEEFDKLFFNNIDDYLKQDWDIMEEKFTMDNDGDLTMNEDLEDISYHQNEYKLVDVFLEDAQASMDASIDKSLYQDQIDRHVNVVLHNLPTSMRIVFELFTKNHLTIEEIAVIRKSNVADTNKLLDDARKAIQVSLLNRYPVE